MDNRYERYKAMRAQTWEYQERKRLATCRRMGVCASCGARKPRDHEYNCSKCR